MCALLTCSLDAAASPSYPEAVAEALNLSCAPRCTLCHAEPQGGIGTLRDDSFGSALADIGDLLDREPSKVAGAIAAVERAGVDSDGDGVSDVAELRANRDPTVPGEGVLCGPRYGCGAHIAPERARVTSSAPVAVLLGLLGALTLRRVLASRPRA